MKLPCGHNQQIQQPDNECEIVECVECHQEFFVESPDNEVKVSEIPQYEFWSDRQRDANIRLHLTEVRNRLRSD